MKTPLVSSNRMVGSCRVSATKVTSVTDETAIDGALLALFKAGDALLHEAGPGRRAGDGRRSVRSGEV